MTIAYYYETVNQNLTVAETVGSWERVTAQIFCVTRPLVLIILRLTKKLL